MDKLVEKLKTYKFTDELGHPLENCVDYQNLIAELEKAQRKFVTLNDSIADYQEYQKSDQETIEGLKKENRKLKTDVEFLKGAYDNSAQNP